MLPMVFVSFSICVFFDDKIVVRLSHAVEGASAPSAVNLTQVSTFLANNCGGIFSGQAHTDAIAFSTKLDDYNNGESGVPHCDDDDVPQPAPQPEPAPEPEPVPQPTPT